MKKKHDWNSLKHYLDIHDTILSRYQSDIQNFKPYSVEFKNPHYGKLVNTGLLLTTYQPTVIRIDIDKGFEIRMTKGGPEVRTTYYKYSANHPNGKLILRYCSPHSDHRQFHHKHIYSGSTQKVLHIPDDDWPHVNEFLDEVMNGF